MVSNADERYIPEAVVAIDFGTTYTGYAYTFKSEYTKSNEAREIFHNRWASDLAGNLSKKAPTVALFDAENNFHSFGYAAEEQYTYLAERKEHKEWHYFSRFKMELYGKLDLDQDFEIKDQLNRPFKANTVFSESIKFLKKQILDEFADRNPVREENIRWVLTVPAIWNEPAKQFMKDAAYKAGIQKNKLRLALEPEAAAIYCRTLPQGMFKGISKEDVLNFLRPGGRYMILDMGGGTVDIAVHEVDKDGSLIEIIPASGGDWGGTSVDKKFFDYINKKMNPSETGRLKQEKTSHWLKLENNFESTKRKIKSSTTHDVRLDIPPVLIIEGKLDINLGNSFKMDIPNQEFLEFFESVVDVIDHVEHILDQVEGINLILMVGGYSQSDYVTGQIKEKFPNLNVLVPLKAEVAVMEGAVMFGFEPWTVSARMCRHTYGIRCTKLFKKGFHREEYRKLADRTDVCINVFRKVVTAGEFVKIDEKRTETLISQHYAPHRKHLEMKVPIFASKEEDPTYTTDDGCQEIGTIIITPPENGWPDTVTYRLEIYFGRTEFDVKVFNDANDAEYDTKFDLLVEKDIPSVPLVAHTEKTSGCVIS